MGESSVELNQGEQAEVEERPFLLMFSNPIMKSACCYETLDKPSILAGVYTLVSTNAFTNFSYLPFTQIAVNCTENCFILHFTVFCHSFSLFLIQPCPNLSVVQNSTTFRVLTCHFQPSTHNI